MEKPGDEEPLSINRSLGVAINSSGENGFTGFSLKVPCTRVLPTSEGQAHVFYHSEVRYRIFLTV